MPAEVATKLVYMLHTLSKVLETEDLEDRLDKLEKVMDGNL